MTEIALKKIEAMSKRLIEMHEISIFEFNLLNTLILNSKPGPCIGCGRETIRRKQGTTKFVCIDCAH